MQVGWVLSLVALFAARAAAQQVAPPRLSTEPAESLVVTPAFLPDRFVARDAPLELRLNRATLPQDGELAVTIGNTDVTALLERDATRLRLPPRRFTLPSGATTVIVYRVTNGQWTPIARHPVQVLRRGGFTQISLVPTAALNNKGQLAEGRSAAVSAPERPHFQDFTVATGVRTTHTAPTWSIATQANVLGASRREEALRFGQRQDDAPRLDLADYLVQLQRGRLQIALGHVSFGANRHLMNGFGSRGVTASFGSPRATLAVGMLNGSTMVGWDDLVGLDESSHRVGGASLGLEMVPKRPGAVRINVSAVDGSLLPQQGFSQGAVVDAEASRGGGVEVSAATASQRLRLAAGYSRSRFDNPRRDAQLFGDSSIVPVRAETRGAHYVELNVGLLENVKLARRLPTRAAIGVRHERVDPLFRSVTAFTQADRRQHGVDVTGSIGTLTMQIAHTRSGDNLAHVPSVLTSLSRGTTASVTMPLASLVRNQRRAPLLPQLSWSLNRTHQVADGVPSEGQFRPQDIPDQLSTTHDAGAQWQAGRWRVGYRFNRASQDNRQPGRERSDLTSSVNTLSLGTTFGTKLDGSLDASLEGQSNRELATRMHVRRLGTTLGWRPFQFTSLTTNISATSNRDEPRTSDATNAEIRGELSQGVRLWRTAEATPNAQLFLRFASTSATSLRLAALGEPAPPRDERRQWTLSSGFTLRFW